MYTTISTFWYFLHVHINPTIIYIIIIIIDDDGCWLPYKYKWWFQLYDCFRV